jgi:hypothetical protein
MSTGSIWRSGNKKERLILFTLGIALIAFAIYLFNSSINQTFTNTGNLMKLLISPELGILGMIFIIVNFNTEDNKVKIGLGVVVGIAIGGLIFNNPFRIATLILLVDIIIFMVITFFALYSIFWFALAAVLLVKMPTYSYAIIYSCITLCLVTYLLFAGWVNGKLLKNMWGEDKAKNYDYDTLKDNLTLIYIIIFILLNVSAALYNDKLGYYNLINNSFLTIITILQINWKKLFHIKDKKSKNT